MLRYTRAMSTPRLLLLAAALTSAAPARAGTAYYEADDPNPAPLKYPEAMLLATLKQTMSTGKVTNVKALGGGAVDVAKLSRIERIALLYLVSTKPGAEVDAVIEDAGQFTPVE